ncbi:signal transduction diguanylate phosphodiesterase [Oleiphilus messinensis]|uniref:Signal transduction diguanylate phosphodiesterase n=1 Tax=Oleiphilus messinensis TaxID=141451 RepID=A0A1Y0IDF2_9GAMM|nr:HDOD domain-containing protein [Oleiphilus messinensis]ARU57806.1 signal transduction diguanylate phosphodiesterase [Oleiphilus messinensis]
MDKELIDDPVFMDLLMARQPIYDTNSHLYGYELLFRNTAGFTAEHIGLDKATSQVLVNLCTSIERQYQQLKQPLFINITREFLLSEVFFPVEPGAVVLELLETIDVDELLVEAVKEWKAKGFRFALDDYCFDPRFDPLLSLVDFIKVDLVQRPLEFILERVKTLDKSHCKLIAEKVEDKVVLYKCREAGFDLFQGYYLAMPDKVFGKSIKPAYQGVFQIVQKLQSGETDIDQLAKVVANEPRFVYQLLRVLNSPACRLRRKVDNIKEAIIFLGLDQLRKWAMLILLASADDDETELVRILLTRARACERFAELSERDDCDRYFMAGLLSGLDLLLKVEKAVALAQISLGPEVRNAVLLHEGEIGKTLDSVFDIEHSQWEPLGQLPTDDRRKIFIAHFEGGLWAHETVTALSA